MSVDPISSQLKKLKKKFEIFNKLYPSWYNWWVLEHEYRVVHDLCNLRELDNTITRDVRKDKQLRFASLLPHVHILEVEWNDELIKRIEVLRKRVKFVETKRTELETEWRSFENMISSLPEGSTERRKLDRELEKFMPFPNFMRSKTFVFLIFLAC